MPPLERLSAPAALFPALVLCRLTCRFSLPSEKREKSLLLPPPPPATVLFFCFVCCRTSGKSGLYGLSPVPPLLFSLKPASVRLLPRLLTFLRTPSRSLRPSSSHFPALISLGLSQHWSSPLPRKCFFPGLPGRHMPASLPFTQSLTDPGMLVCPQDPLLGSITLTALLISCGLVPFNPSVRRRILNLGFSLHCSPEGQTHASHCPHRAFPRGLMDTGQAVPHCPSQPSLPVLASGSCILPNAHPRLGAALPPIVLSSPTSDLSQNPTPGHHLYCPCQAPSPVPVTPPSPSPPHCYTSLQAYCSYLDPTLTSVFM